MKTSITTAEKYQLLGLLTLGRQHGKTIKELEEAAKEILEAEDLWDLGNFSDAIWDSDVTISAILKDIGIEVRG